MALDRWRPFGTSVSRWEPFQDMNDIQHEVNRLFDSVFGRPTMVGTGERQWLPLSDMWETRDDLHVAFELPGIQEKDVSVSITGDVLTVRGERKWHQDVPGAAVHRMERVAGKFERSVPLPVPVQTDKVKATYRAGVLEIRLPKAEEVKPREIEIDVL